MFWKKKIAISAPSDPSEKSAEELLLNLVSYIPEEHKQALPYQNCVAHLQQRDYPAAIHSLVELADLSTHYFYKEYYEELARAAAKLGMYALAESLLQFVEENRRQVCIPYGWSMGPIQKTDDPLVSTQETFISAKVRLEYKYQMFEKDNVAKMLGKDGFHFKSHGRAAALYYVKNGQLTFFDCELDMAGMGVYMQSLVCWYLPVMQNMTEEERNRVIEEFKAWNNKKFKFNRLIEYWP